MEPLFIPKSSIVNYLKKINLLLFLLIITVNVSAQIKDSAGTSLRNNIIKINLSALLFKNISVQYERKITRKTSLALNVHYIPFGKAPFKSAIEKAIDDPSVKIDQFQLGNFGITPEYRFYVGKQGALHGFYIGPFASYNEYKTDFPVNYSNDTRTGIFTGKLKAYTFGLQLGAQWKLSKSIYLDWWILGPNYGSAKGDLILTTALTVDEQNALSKELENLKNDVPLKVIKSYSVYPNGAVIVAKGPWAGLRGLGFNLGFRF